MPTGYTYPVADGTVTEFKDFAMSCARAFGALVTMRDDPADAPIPDELKPSDYHERRLVECRARLAEVETMTPAEAEAAALAAYEEEKAVHDKYEAAEAAAEKRLDDMLTKVRGWEPPTAEHVGLKNFMIEQITTSKRGSWRPAPPAPKPAQEWLTEQIKKLHGDIGYHAAEHAKEIERTRGRTEWLKALRSSLAA